MAELTVVFDFKSPHAYLALEPTLAMLTELDQRANWQPTLVAPQQRPRRPEVAGDRGAAHRWHRAVYRINDLRRYARARGLADDCFSDARLFDCGSGEVAAAGYQWAQRRAPEAGTRLLQQLFAGFWLGDLDINDGSQVAAVIEDCTGLDYAQASDEALAEFAAAQEPLQEYGIVDVPGYLVGEHVYCGRQHLAMVQWHLCGEAGNAPAWGRYPE
jgi:2-hydroxychromene-2-carboxylate isomerase